MNANSMTKMIILSLCIFAVALGKAFPGSAKDGFTDSLSGFTGNLPVNQSSLPIGSLPLNQSSFGSLPVGSLPINQSSFTNQLGSLPIGSSSNVKAWTDSLSGFTGSFPVNQSSFTGSLPIDQSAITGGLGSLPIGSLGGGSAPAEESS